MSFSQPEFPVSFPVSERAANLAHVFAYVTTPILFVSFATFVARLYQRTRPNWNVGLDDYFIIIGAVSL